LASAMPSAGTSAPPLASGDQQQDRGYVLEDQD
jgi:hypothetical protein